MNLGDTFIQSDLQCIQSIYFYMSMCVPSDSYLCGANAMLYQLSHRYTMNCHCIEMSRLYVKILKCLCSKKMTEFSFLSELLL